MEDTEFFFPPVSCPEVWSGYHSSQTEGRPEVIPPSDPHNDRASRASDAACMKEREGRDKGDERNF